MNSQYPSHHHGNDGFGFVPSQHGPYSMNSQFRSSSDVPEHHDYVAAQPYLSQMDHDNLNWSGNVNLNSHAPYAPQTGVSFAPDPSSSNFFHASYGSADFPMYNMYDHPFSPNGLLPGDSSFPHAPHMGPGMMHPSRSAPSSCSTSPLGLETATDYLDVPYRTDRSTSREHSPAKSDTDPNDAKRRFPCLMEGCARRFTSQYTLRVHMEAHKPKPKVVFECTLGCTEKFSRQHDRLRHEVSKHGKICEFLCDDCGRFFSSRKTLGNHKCPVTHGTTRWMDS